MMDIMEARVVKLASTVEKILERLSAVERDVAVIRSDYATKADMAALQASKTALEAKMLRWFVTTHRPRRSYLHHGRGRLRRCEMDQLAS